MAGAATIDWIYEVGGWTLAGVGGVLLLWALFWDRSRGRRRCPKCWYDMAGVPGLKCPECGGDAQAERRLFRTRRRWRAAACGVVLALLGPGLWIASIIRSGEWPAHLPSTALILLVGRSGDVRIERELHHRAERGDGAIGWIERSALWEWQWRLLKRRCESAIASEPGSSPRWDVAMWTATLCRDWDGNRDAPSVAQTYPPGTESACPAPDDLAAQINSGVASPVASLVVLSDEPRQEDDGLLPCAAVVKRFDSTTDGVDAVVRTGSEWRGVWTLFFLSRRDGGWVLRGRLVLSSWYQASAPRIEERAGHAFVEWTTASGGTGTAAYRDAWYSIPDRRQVASYDVLGWEYPGGYAPMAFGYTTEVAATPDGAGFDVTTTLTYANDGYPRGAGAGAIPWKDIGELFTRRWRDHYQWSEASRRFLRSPSVLLDGWVLPGAGPDTQLAPRMGEPDEDAVLSLNMQTIADLCVFDPGVRQWAEATAAGASPEVRKSFERALAGPHPLMRPAKIPPAEPW